MSAETEFPCHRSNAMNGKTAFVLLSGVLSGSLCACVRLLELSPDDRAAASLFYIGYQAARFRSRAINVAAIPNAEEWAESYCAEHAGRPAVEAFRQAYRQTLRR